MAAKEFKFSVILSAVDKMTAVIDKAVNKSVRKFGKLQKSADAVSKSAGNIGKKMGGMAAASAAALAVPIKMASDFEDGMGNVATLIDTNVENMDAMGKKVLEIGKRVPVGIGDLTDGLFDVRSAGISAGDAMTVLESSARLAVSGLSTTKEATNIMTSALNAFASEGLTADQAANLFFKTAKAGKTTIAELSQAFGATAPVVQAAGVRLADFQAATAALTTLGIPAAQAQGQIRAAVVSLEKPTKQMQKIFQALGVKDGKELIKTSGGLGAAFTNIKETAAKMNINMAVAASSIEATNAITALSGSVNESYVNTLEDMTDGSNALSTAFDKQKAGTKAQFQLLKNNGAALAIQLGRILLPIINKVLESLIKFAGFVGDLAERYPRLTKVIVIGIASFGALAAAGSVVAFAVSGVAKGVSLMAGGMRFASIAISVMSRAFWALNAAVLANPIVIAVVLIVAAIAALVIFWEEFNSFLDAQPAFIGGVMRAILAPMLLVAGLIRGVIEAFTGDWRKGLQMMWDSVRAFTPIDLFVDMFNGIFDFFAGIGPAFFDAGVNIINSLWEGMKSLAFAPIQTVADMTMGMREYLPFSPAKKGAFRDLDKVKIVETMMANFNPAPAVQGVAGLTNNLTNQLGGAPASTGGAAPVGGGGGVNLTFAPTINVGGAADGSGATTQEQILKALRQATPDLLRIIQQGIARAQRRAFGG